MNSLESPKVRYLTHLYAKDKWLKRIRQEFPKSAGDTILEGGVWWLLLEEVLNLQHEKTLMKRN